MDKREVREAFAYCERVARSHYENFPVGWFVPRSMRRHVYALYAFARGADDLADESLHDGRRLDRLREWRERLQEAARGKGGAPVFVALSETFRQTEVNPELLADLLIAFEQDVVRSSYADFGELLSYCRYSANPIGRLVLLLFGYQDPPLFALSDKICTGIQLVNHWQDIAVDLKKNRVYLPEEDLKHFGYSRSDLEGHKINEAFVELMKFEIDRTRRFFYEGLPLLRRLRSRLRWQVGLMWKGPMRILEKIEEVGYDIFRRRPSLSGREKVQLFFKRI